jgi:hypothetical protein
VIKIELETHTKEFLMKRIITIYTEHKNATQFYLRNTLEKFHPSSFNAKDMKRFFEFEKAAEWNDPRFIDTLVFR